MTLFVRLIVAVLLATTTFHPAPAGLSHPSVQVLLAEPPPPQSDGEQGRPPPGTWRLLIALLCVVGLSTAALGSALAIRRRIDRISPDK